MITYLRTFSSNLNSLVSLQFFATNFRSVYVLMALLGSKEGQGSSTFLQTRQVRWWQTEEEGSHFSS